MIESISLTILSDRYSVFLAEDIPHELLKEISGNTFPSAILNEEGERNMLCKMSDVPKAARGKGIIHESLIGIQIIREDIDHDEEHPLMLFMSKTAPALYEKGISLHVLSGYDYDYLFADEINLPEFIAIAEKYFSIEKE